MSRIDQTNTKFTRIQQNPACSSNDIKDETSIDVIGLFFHLMEHMKLIILGAAIGTIVAGIWTFYFVVPQYKATAKIYVLSPGDSVINLADIQLGTALTADYQEVFKNWIVHERVIQALGLSYSYDALSKMLSVTNPPNTRILYITVTSSNALEAKTIADTYASVAQEFIESTFDTKQPNLFEEALFPSMPFEPNKTKNIAIGFLLGLLLSCGVITTGFITGDSIRSSEDVERISGLSILGTIPMQEKTNKAKARNSQKNHKTKKEVC